MADETVKGPVKTCEYFVVFQKLLVTFVFTKKTEYPKPVRQHIMGHLYNNFLASLQTRYPVKSDLVNALADMLHLEKESVYRRLRGDVHFSAEEMMRIAGKWDISLDNIVSANPGKTLPFSLHMVEFLEPTEEDYAILEQHNRDLELVAADPKGFGIEIVNALPRALYARSEHLARFFSMKWCHKFKPENALPFSRVQMPKRLRKIDLEYIEIEHRFSEMHSIHDPRMIENLVDEMVYYRSIGMLTCEETILLRDELLSLVDYMEEVTRTGYFPETGNKLFFYLSHIWIEAECQLFCSASFNLSMVKVLKRNFIASTDRSALDLFMKMALATKRMSVLMSQSNALKQAEFFTRQREIIMTL